MCWLYIERLAIRYALGSKPPEKWDVLTDGPVPDHFVVNLIDREGQRKFIVLDIDGQGVSGLWFDTPRSEPDEKSLSNKELRDYRAIFYERWQDQNVTYVGPLRLFWGQATAAPRRQRLADKLAQAWFNQWPLARRGRLEVLRFFLEKTVLRRDYKASYVDLIADMFGKRYVQHPEEEEADTYYELILESLKASGDLHDHQGTYSLTPQAIQTLAAYEEEERRHRDNIWIQRLLLLITAATIGVAVWQEYHPDPSEPPTIQAPQPG